LLAELGWQVSQVGDELHGQAEIFPELWVPGLSQLRLSVMAAWADQLMGLAAVHIMKPRVPSTLSLELHMREPAPARGLVRGRARLVKTGRSVLVASVEFSMAGNILAEGIGSFMLAADPGVRLPEKLSLDRPADAASLSVPIARRARCERLESGVATIPLLPDARNSANSLHGGLLALAAEEALLSLAPGRALASLSLHYLRPVRTGPARATAELHGDFGKAQLVDQGQDDRLAVLATARVA
jgi:acyl-coenzyme A thioesterase PaaI-like protein